MVNKLPSYEIPQANIDKIPIPGRDGFLTQDNGTYGEVIKPCECSLDNGNIDDISAWLNGSSNITFSNEPDKFYKATIINKIPFSKIIEIFHTFIIQFDCQPHKYMVDNSKVILTSAGTIFNSGGAISKPIIKLYGTGAITLNINDDIIDLTNVSEYIEINSDMQNAHKGTQPKNQYMKGYFPLLIPGNNYISWTGTVAKLEITPNWRSL